MKAMQEQLLRIKNKIDRLKSLDNSFSIFGAAKHRYKLNPVLSLTTVRNFELSQGITLPDEYKGFLTQIGNGGVGPFYGLEPLENTLFADLDYKNAESLLNPSSPFLHTKPWNMVFQPTVEIEENEVEYERQLDLFQNNYFDPCHINGVIAICNYGCAIGINLVVNGEAYGSIWSDDRASDNGIHPSVELGNKESVGFLDWYELWLDNSIAEIASTKPVNSTEVIGSKNRKDETIPWWKFW